MSATVLSPLGKLLISLQNTRATNALSWLYSWYVRPITRSTALRPTARRAGALARAGAVRGSAAAGRGRGCRGRGTRLCRHQQVAGCQHGRHDETFSASAWSADVGRVRRRQLAERAARVRPSARSARARSSRSRAIPFAEGCSCRTSSEGSRGGRGTRVRKDGDALWRKTPNGSPTPKI